MGTKSSLYGNYVVPIRTVVTCYILPKVGSR